MDRLIEQAPTRKGPVILTAQQDYATMCQPRKEDQVTKIFVIRDDDAVILNGKRQNLPVTYLWQYRSNGQCIMARTGEIMGHENARRLIH